jgi:hypothetical protein
VTVDLSEPADLELLSAKVAELRELVRAQGMKVGIALHRWLDASRIDLVLFPGTPAAKTEAEDFLKLGFDVGFPDFDAATPSQEAGPADPADG